MSNVSDDVWLPPAADDLTEMPVPCPNCRAETFDERGGTFTCSDCGWTRRGNRAYKTRPNHR